ncbi:hypothetical protein CSAL01_05568 [Colletotrichum salicis]|uniref:Uncharacterized protein n=1 Tax=Colletotrichum salicis TaxID=1209931 RepID=A0A135V5T5_9PEZI|nr:hypothetical protein CSAL01_05568 [Colletotrichum salicis]
MNDSQRLANLQTHLRNLRHAIEWHQCGLASATFFQCEAIASIDHINSIVASLVQKQFPSYPGTSCFHVFQSRPLPLEHTNQQNPPSKTTNGQLTTFCNNIPQNLQDWTEKRDTLGLTTTDGIQAVFRNIVLPNSQPTALPTTADQRGVIKHNVTSSSGDSSAQHAGVSTVKDLVFFGECRVALKLGSTVAEVDEIAEQYMSTRMDKKTLSHYRNVPQKISKWMDQLYDDCGCAGFELFLHAKRTISNYDKLTRTSDIDTAFPERVRPLIPTELCKKDISTKLVFYLPFLVWASMLLKRNKDCFEEVRDAFSMEKFKHSDFKQCLLFLGKDPSHVPPAPPAQPAGSPRNVEIDIANTKTACPKPSAPGLLKRKSDCPDTRPRDRPRRSPPTRPPTCPPYEPAVPHHMTMEVFTEGSESRTSGTEELGNQRSSAVYVSHGGVGQQLSIRRDETAHSTSLRAAVSENPVHCDPGSLAIGYGPLQQLPEPPEARHFSNYAQAAGDVNIAVACYGLGQLIGGSDGIEDIVNSGAAALAWTPEGLSNQYSAYTGALGCSAAVDPVSVDMNTGSGQLGGVQHCFTL